MQTREFTYLNLPEHLVLTVCGTKPTVIFFFLFICEDPVKKVYVHDFFGHPNQIQSLPLLHFFLITNLEEARASLITENNRKWIIRTVRNVTSEVLAVIPERKGPSAF